MGARQKLNEAYLFGQFLIAGVAGMVTNSFIVFVCVFVFLVSSSIHSGGIRVKGRQ